MDRQTHHLKCQAAAQHAYRHASKYMVVPDFMILWPGEQREISEWMIRGHMDPAKILFESIRILDWSFWFIRIIRGITQYIQPY